VINIKSKLTSDERLILQEAARIKRKMLEMTIDDSDLFWEQAEGKSLGKIRRMFRTEDHDNDTWFVLSEKISGKTVFAREHGIVTFYVVGVDGYAYSMKVSRPLSSFDLSDFQDLVSAARTEGRTITKGSGIYRNFEVVL
jgi:hypothetical protein